MELSRNDLIRAIKIQKELKKREAKNNFLDFVCYTKPDYSPQDFHIKICKVIDDFINGNIKKLMLFVPPQYGKSELTSRRLPARLFGINPNLKIAGISYNMTFARKFNKDIQRIMESPEYLHLYPELSLLETKNKTGYIRNTEEFEINGFDGSYVATGVGGGLTGRKVDIAILDDVIKDSAEANSEIYRNRVWEWYLNVLLTRLHNDSQQIITFTRWHNDDLAGRILEHEDDWEVLIFPALNENNKSIWEERHSTEKLLKTKKINPKGFESLYMQNPTIQEGNIIKRGWFNIINKSELPFSLENIKVDLWIDGAYTSSTKNDPSAITSCVFFKNNLYISNSIQKWLELYELLDFLPKFAEANHYTRRGIVMIEPKASGKSIRSMLNKKGFNAVEISNKIVGLGKIARAEDASPTIQSGKVFLLKGSWNEQFINECATFPNGKHDDQLDNLCYMINFYFLKPKALLPK